MVNNYPLAFYTNDTERMRIDSSGNVGIGTTSPTYKFQVSNTNGDTQLGVYDLSSSSSAARLDIRTSGTGASQWFIQTGNTASGLNGALRFYDQLGTSERMRIDASGNLMVNTTTSNAKLTVHATSGAAPSYFKVFTNGDAGTYYANASGTVVGSITVNASATAYNTSSDYRLKENIVPMTGALDKVTQLKPVTYTWKINGSDGQGFIAHELQEVVPDCVTGTKDEIDENGNPKYQGVDTSFLVATLTAAIQEMKAIIDEQSARITALENK
jgi:hypothetical protein